MKIVGIRERGPQGKAKKNLGKYKISAGNSWCDVLELY